MKNLVVICVVLGVLGLVKGYEESEYKKEYRPLIDECNSAGNYTEDDIEGALLRSENWSDEAMCLKACADEKYGFIKDGKYIDPLEELKKKFTDGEINFEALERSSLRCYGEANEYGKGDICKAAFYVGLCFKHNID